MNDNVVSMAFYHAKQRFDPGWMTTSGDVYPPTPDAPQHHVNKAFSIAPRPFLATKMRYCNATQTR
jgi:hypothetical protein